MRRYMQVGESQLIIEDAKRTPALLGSAKKSVMKTQLLPKELLKSATKVDDPAKAAKDELAKSREKNRQIVTNSGPWTPARSDALDAIAYAQQVANAARQQQANSGFRYI